MVDEWDGTKFVSKYFLTVTDLDTNDDGTGSDPSFLTSREKMMVHNGSTSSMVLQ